MKKRVTALALLLCLLLSACSGKRVEDNSQGQASLLGEAADLQDEFILLTVDGREVPAWRYLFWLGRTCGQIVRQYEKAGVELDWEARLESETLEEYAKEQALADTVLYATVENWAETYGCAPTDEEKAETFWIQQENFGLSQKQCEELARVGMLYTALGSLFCTEGSVLYPEKEQLAAFAEETGYITVDRILIAAGENPEDARRRAEEIFSELNHAEDQEAVFAELAAAGDDPAGLRTILPGEGFLDPELEEAAAALDEGQLSGVLESEEGFSILRRSAKEAECLLEPYFDTCLQRTAESAVITTTAEYDNLEAAEFWQAMKQEK